MRADLPVRPMIEELERSNLRLANLMKKHRSALDSIRHGIIVVGPDSEVQICNVAAIQLLELPPHMAEQPFSIRDAFPKLSALEVLFSDEDHAATIEKPDGTIIQIHVDPQAEGGIVIVIEDITRERAGQRELRLAETEYRSLFENSVCGIYRDKLDGTPVRANIALANLNGYDSEAQYQKAVSERREPWYVDPGRSAQFMKTMETEGRVHDFVSEVYRHRTRKKFWITENAWYVRDEFGTPIYIEGTIQDATERMLGLAAIERQANTDPLTGAASRFHFMNVLNSLTRDPGSICVLFTIDLDKFKEVNDLLGHGAGDTVLKTVVSRLRAIAGPQSTVARLGGDEFAVLMTGNTAAIKADITAGEMVRALRTPIEILGYNACVGASVGVVLYPAHASDTKELLNHADMALYRVKSSGRNSYCIFDHDMKSRLQQRQGLEAELREAIPAGELELYYQPIVSSGDNLIVGYEALMRWNHPRRGLLPPGDFIQVAEDAGLMTELGNWAIRRACKQAVLMPGDLSVAVNVSPSQFRSSHIVDVVRDVLSQTGLAANRLTLEVTESVILSSEAVASRIIEELLGLGVRLALDDFGTGYSSLSYLQRYAFSKVKIDRSFVAGIEAKPANLAIIRAIIKLGGDLGIDVVAEGIETENQARILKAEGCGQLQGYLYGRPKPLADVFTDTAVQNLRELVPVKRAPPAVASFLKRTVSNGL